MVKLATAANSQQSPLKKKINQNLNRSFNSLDYAKQDYHRIYEYNAKNKYDKDLRHFKVKEFETIVIYQSKNYYQVLLAEYQID